MPASRSLRIITLIGLLLAAILSPTLHVRSTDRPVNYTVAFHVTHPSSEAFATHYRLAALTHETSPNPCFYRLPSFVTSRPCAEPLRPTGEVTPPAASASPDRLSNFQLPPPQLQA